MHSFCSSSRTIDSDFPFRGLDDQDYIAEPFDVELVLSNRWLTDFQNSRFPAVPKDKRETSKHHYNNSVI